MSNSTRIKFAAGLQEMLQFEKEIDNNDINTTKNNDDKDFNNFANVTPQVAKNGEDVQALVVA